MPAMAMTITGRIIEQDSKLPELGAAIYVSGNTSIGTTVDDQGNFTLTNVPEGATVVIKSMGFHDKTLPAQPDMGTIELQEANETIDAAVVKSGFTSGRPCNESDLAKINAKSGEYILAPWNKNAQICEPKSCIYGYKRIKKDSASKNLADLTKTYKEWVCEKLECKGPRYVLNTAGDDCDDMDGQTCKSTDAKAVKSKYEWTGSELKCVVKTCEKNYLPTDDGKSCRPSEGPCTDAQIKAIAHATKGELKKGVCHATECEGGYDSTKDGKCIEISGKCSPMPANAKSAHREYDEATKAEKCVIDECDKGYSTSDGKSCVENPTPKLSEEDSKKKVAELQENADAMHEKENSAANKLIGAAGMAATGLGAMNMMSAIAEQRADADAEQDMQAYLQTIKCSYNDGQTFNNGEKNIQTPGGNDMVALYTEYAALANNLKIRKDALGLRPGIESEIVIDKAATGLYDDVGTGKTGGNYASIARALMDETSQDAKQWQEQKDKTKNTLIAGATTAGIGAVGSLAANIAVNSKSTQEKSAQISNHYEALKKLESDVAALPDNEAKTQCPAGASGTFPNCTCPQSAPVHNKNLNKCEAATSAAKCDTRDLNITVDKDGDCACKNGYRLTANGQRCECPAITHQESGGKCTLKMAAPIQTVKSIIELPRPVAKIELNNRNLFETGKSDLSADAKKSLANFAKEAKEMLAAIEEYCFFIIGHTDKTGNAQLNQKLSTERANAVKDALIANGLDKNKIQAQGFGESNCKEDGDQPNCRNVFISISSYNCPLAETK